MAKEIRLPFGWLLSRDSQQPYTSIEDREKTAYTGLYKREKPNTDKGKPRFNALSAAPDKSRLTDNTNLPDASNFAGRKTKDTEDTVIGWNIWDSYASRKSKFGKSIAHKLDIDNVENLDFDYLAELCAELSPEVSKALWDYLLLTNAGYTAKAFKLDAQREAYPEAQAYLDQIIAKLGQKNGTIKVFFDRLYKTMFLRGGILMELVIDTNGEDFADIATPDPKTLVFKRKNDAVIGQYWTFGQKRDNQFIDLQIPTVRYVPLHPNPDSIQGTPMVTSVFFTAIFLMAVLRDIKRVIQHQGYMRLDVEVVFDKLLETVPEETRTNPEALAIWMKEVVAQVEHAYSTLEPDDTYVHNDAIKINNPVGTVSADSLKAIDSLFKVLERMAVRGLKTIPLLMAADQVRGEVQANREWEIYAKGIEIIQHLIETPMEELLGLALRAKGFQCKVEVRFDTFRAAEKMRDAQVDLLVANLARFLYDCGIISQDKMAEMCGFDKSDQSEPRVVQSASSPTGLQNVIQENPEDEKKKSAVSINLDFLRQHTPDLFEDERIATLIERYVASNGHKLEEGA